MYMAASLGLGHETFAHPPPASSYCFPPDLVASNCAATNFLPPAAAMADDFFPELGTGYYSPPQVFARENEQMNMSYMDDGRWMSRSAAAAGNGGGRLPTSRIGFRTRSAVDVLDDGFKWRKYGKKAVKSSPNPRNYYRCSVEGCGVKKRVERDPDDPRYVVTTYDGVHNHAAPACAAAGYHHAPPPSAPAPAPAYAAATTMPPVPSDVWGMQTAHSSESSY